jgi:large subunit ribosomal protein L3
MFLQKMNALLGKKIGMTQIFNPDGSVAPVSVIEVGPCVVTQVKNIEKDGYRAVQVGFLSKKALNKPLAGHCKKSGATPMIMREFKISDNDIKIEVGKELTVDLFKDMTYVHISGISKGKGFAGVIKRHNFSRGPETHGSDHHRAPGSIGSMFPQHTLKGKRLPGHMGSERITVQNLKVVSVDAKQGLLMVKGAVPGANGTILEIVGK